MLAPLSGGAPPATMRTGLPQVWPSTQKKVWVLMAWLVGWRFDSEALGLKGARSIAGGRPATSRHEVGGDGRLRHAVMAVAEGVDDMRLRLAAPITGSESGKEGRKPIQSVPVSKAGSPSTNWLALS